MIKIKVVDIIGIIGSFGTSKNCFQFSIKILYMDME